jgi:hypothetical protein
MDVDQIQDDGSDNDSRDDDNDVYDDEDDDDVSFETQTRRCEKAQFSHDSLRKSLRSTGIASRDGNSHFVLQVLGLTSTKQCKMTVTLSDGVSKIRAEFPAFTKDCYVVPGTSVQVQNIAWARDHWTIASMKEVAGGTHFFGNKLTEIKTPPAEQPESRQPAVKRPNPEYDVTHVSLATTATSAAAAATLVDEQFPDLLSLPRTKRSMNEIGSNKKTDKVASFSTEPAAVIPLDPLSAAALLGATAATSFTGITHARIKDLQHKQKRFYLGPLKCCQLRDQPADKTTCPVQAEFSDKDGNIISYKAFRVSFNDLSRLFIPNEFYFLANGEVQVSAIYGLSVLFNLQTSSGREQTNYDLILQSYRVPPEKNAELKRAFSQGMSSADAKTIEELIALSTTTLPGATQTHRNVSVRCIVAEVSEPISTPKSTYRRVTLAQSLHTKITVTSFKRSALWPQLEELFGADKFRCTADTVRAFIFTNMTVNVGAQFPYNFTDQTTVSEILDTEVPAASDVIAPIASTISLSAASTKATGEVFSVVVLIPACSEPRTSTFEGRTATPKCVLNIVDFSGPDGMTRARLNLSASSPVVAAVRKSGTSRPSVFAPTDEGTVVCSDPNAVVAVYFQNLSVFVPQSRATGTDMGGFGGSTEVRKFFTYNRDSSADVLAHTDPRCAELVNWYAKEGITKFSPDLLANKDAILNGVNTAQLDGEIRFTQQQRAVDSAMLASMTSRTDDDVEPF